jgi:hypothetical protein
MLKKLLKYLIILFLFFYIGCESISNELFANREYIKFYIIDERTLSIALDTLGNIWVNFHNNPFNNKITRRKLIFSLNEIEKIKSAFENKQIKPEISNDIKLS